MSMGNTEYRLLCLSGDRAALVTPLGAVRSMYRDSRQPLKKAKTMEGYMRAMCRRGWMRCVGTVEAGTIQAAYLVTPAGRAAALAHQRRRAGDHLPARMRLAD